MISDQPFGCIDLKTSKLLVCLPYYRRRSQFRARRTSITAMSLTKRTSILNGLIAMKNPLKLLNPRAVTVAKGMLSWKHSKLIAVKRVFVSLVGKSIVANTSVLPMCHSTSLRNCLRYCRFRILTPAATSPQIQKKIYV